MAASHRHQMPGATRRPPVRGAQPARAQRGVVLMIAMIMLIIVSVLALSGLRGATSTEGIAGNVRTAELATQAADLALRHCEASAFRHYLNSLGDLTSTNATYSTTMAASQVLSYADPPAWRDVAGTWNSSSASVYVLPSTMVGTPYQRQPECMVEELPAIMDTGTTRTAKSYVITVRGFGPEVAALTSTTRVAPVGTVVWLQSTVQFN